MCDGYKALCYYMACDDENDKIQSSEDVSVPGATSPVNKEIDLNRKEDRVEIVMAA
jgi:hypothetical protein